MSRRFLRTGSLFRRMSLRGRRAVDGDQSCCILVIGVIARGGGPYDMLLLRERRSLSRTIGSELFVYLQQVISPFLCCCLLHPQFLFLGWDLSVGQVWQ